MSRTNDRESLWSRAEPGARRPAYTREGITEAAIALADAEGLKAVSMRRLATELGAGTMSLYHYVRTKDELFSLMDDAIMRQLLVPADELPDSWREALAAIARRTRDASIRHPWMGELKHEGEAGPGALRHIEQSLAVVARTGLPENDQLELIMLVDDYVFGYVQRVGQQRAGMDADLDAKVDSIVAYLDTQLKTGAYPHLKAFAGEDTRAAFGRMTRAAGDDDRFERGLRCLLDGIELDVERRL